MVNRLVPNEIFNKDRDIDVDRSEIYFYLIVVRFIDDFVNDTECVVESVITFLLC
jgi:hypothetical protein